MKVFAELPKGRGFVLRVSQEFFQGHQRIDCRVWHETRPGDRDTLNPTLKGVNIELRDLPAVLAALQAACADAIEAGHLRPDDFTRAGAFLSDLACRTAG